MVVAMAGFALEDVFVKKMAGAVPVGQVLALVGGCGGLVFALLARMTGAQLWSPALLSRPVLLRNLAEAVGSAAFVTALVLTTLSGASAILQATPLAVTLGAALFLGEPVGWRRWTAIAVGFAGVLLIIQPGTSGFTPLSFLAVLAVFTLATRDLSSRAVPQAISSLQLSAWGFLSLVPAGAVVLLVMQDMPVMPVRADLLLLAAALLVGGVAYYALVAATRTGDVSAVVPFRYVRLVFAMVLGYLVFGERPNTLMLAGAALIVGMGLYTIWRTAVRQRQREVARKR